MNDLEIISVTYPGATVLLLLVSWRVVSLGGGGGGGLRQECTEMAIVPSIGSCLQGGPTRVARVFMAGFDGFARSTSMVK